MAQPNCCRSLAKQARHFVLQTPILIYTCGMEGCNEVYQLRYHQGVIPFSCCKATEYGMTGTVGK
jgi:hypothetical protein